MIGCLPHHSSYQHGSVLINNQSLTSITFADPGGGHDRELSQALATPRSLRHLLEEDPRQDQGEPGHAGDDEETYQKNE